MIIKKFENKDEWFVAREGKITGSKAKDVQIRITKKKRFVKIGVYQLIADKIAIQPSDEDPMARGNRLEGEAIKEFEKISNKKVDTSLMMWERDDMPDIAYSPDGMISPTEAVEVKCLSSAKHVEVMVTNKIPAIYEDQILQAFVVNDLLKKIHVIFYDDRMLSKKLFVITRKREQEKVDRRLQEEKEILENVAGIVAALDDF